MKLSVLVLTYNHEKYLDQTLESVLTQEVDFKYEVVVGEDCSTDGTRQIAMRWRDRFPDRVRLLLADRNLGMIGNLEMTLAACRGEYIAMLEGDDYWTSPHKLRRQVEFLDQNNACVISCHAVNCIHDDASQPSYKAPTPAPQPVTTIDDILYGNYVYTCSAVLRRSAVPSPLPAWFAGLGLSDWPLFALTADHGDIGYIDEVMAAYRIHKGGVWSMRALDATVPRLMEMQERLLKHFSPRHQVPLERSLTDHAMLLNELRFAAYKESRKGARTRLRSARRAGAVPLSAAMKARFKLAFLPLIRLVRAAKFRRN